MMFIVNSMRTDESGRIIIRGIAAGGSEIGYIEWKQSTYQDQPKMGQQVKVTWEDK